MVEKVRILVVDDDEKVRQSLHRLFQTHAWDVIAASCGQEALAFISAGDQFDAIVADFFMPNMNGLDFLKQVNIRAPETYCIMLTAYPSSHAIVSARGQYLKADLVEKPWTDNLVTMIENALKNRSQQGNGHAS